MGYSDPGEGPNLVRAYMLGWAKCSCEVCGFSPLALTKSSTNRHDTKFRFYEEPEMDLRRTCCQAILDTGLGRNVLSLAHATKKQSESFAKPRRFDALTYARSGISSFERRKFAFQIRSSSAQFLRFSSFERLASSTSWVFSTRGIFRLPRLHNSNAFIINRLQRFWPPPPPC